MTHTPYGFAYTAWVLAQQRRYVNRVFIAHNAHGLHEKFDENSPVRQNESAFYLQVRKLSFNASPYDFYSKTQQDLTGHTCLEMSKTISINLCKHDCRLGILLLREGHTQAEMAQIEALRHYLARLEKKLNHIFWFIKPSQLLKKPASKEIVRRIAGAHYPLSLDTTTLNERSIQGKVKCCLKFIDKQFASKKCFIVKPNNQQNGVGVTLFGNNTLLENHKIAYASAMIPPQSYAQALESMLKKFGHLVIQEYIQAIRQQGEVRFILVKGKIPTHEDGKPFKMALRRPNADSIFTDSGVSEPVELTEAETRFCNDVVGPFHNRFALMYSGGDLIRAGEHFYYTDDASTLCGHIIVTGQLNNPKDPYILARLILNTWLSDCLTSA